MDIESCRVSSQQQKAGGKGSSCELLYGGLPCSSRVPAVSWKGVERSFNNNLCCSNKPQKGEAAASLDGGKKYTFTRVVPNAEQLKVIAQYVEEVSFSPFTAARSCWPGERIPEH